MLLFVYPLSLASGSRVTDETGKQYTSNSRRAPSIPAAFSFTMGEEGAQGARAPRTPGTRRPARRAARRVGAAGHAAKCERVAPCARPLWRARTARRFGMDAAEAGQGEVLVADVGNTETQAGACPRRGAWPQRGRPPRQNTCTADEAYLVLRGLPRCARTPQRRREGRCGRPQAERAGRPTSWLSCVVPDLTEPCGPGRCSAACGRRALGGRPRLEDGPEDALQRPRRNGGRPHRRSGGRPRPLWRRRCVVVDLGHDDQLRGDRRATARFWAGPLPLAWRLFALPRSRRPQRAFPCVEVKAPPSVIGKNTREAVQSGAVLGEAARVDGHDRPGTGRNWATRRRWWPRGADAAGMAALMRHAVHVEEDLALQGLCLLHRMNGKRPAAR